MYSTKSEPPPYNVAAAGTNTPSAACQIRRVFPRRTRRLRFIGLACLAFIAYSQWRQLSLLSRSTSPGLNTYGLSLRRLHEDLRLCTNLHTQPTDPVGIGRERNARYVDGHKPTVIRNATVWVGEPAGAAGHDVWSAEGYSWITADVFLEHGLIKQVAKDIALHALPEDVLVYDAKGRPLTSGIIDMHSHAGVHSLPTLHGNEDVSELSENITPYVRSMDGIQPTDQQLRVIKSGGVTTSLVLPGSSNNIGGEAFAIKHAIGRPDGRNETSVADMLADPDRTWRYMKMACGENAKQVHGKAGERGPYSRLGESWEIRHAFEQATRLLREQDDWCAAAAAAGGMSDMKTYLPVEIRWESLVAVLRHQVHVNVHCYTVPDLEAFVDHTNEFQFRVQAFHHAHQTYMVPEILKRAWGGNPPASALFADNMWYKAEAYLGSERAGKYLYDNKLVPIYVSDNPVLNAQHVVFEAAKAYRYGLPYHAALASVTTAPAERLGLGQRLGRVKPGYDADVVVWDSDPLSVGSTPVQVWIDGTAQFEKPAELNKQSQGPLVPNERLANITSELAPFAGDVVFSGVSKVLLSDTAAPNEQPFNVAVSRGRITCIGACVDELEAAIKRQPNGGVIRLNNGYVTPSFTAFGSTLGLNEVEGERSTDNGDDGNVFSRGFDGLALDTEKLRVSHRYGVTRAISAPKFAGGGTHHGTSVGFLTGATNARAPGSVFSRDVAVHYTLTLPTSRHGSDGSPSLSATVGSLRRKLLSAVASVRGHGGPYPIEEKYSETEFLRGVVTGKIALAITVHSADTIAAILEVKTEVEESIAAAGLGNTAILLVLIGCAEAHLLAHDLASAEVGVVLAPMQSYAVSWDQRRALPGAPLTNNTAIDVLVEAGVVTAIGLEEDWIVRDLGLLAGIAYRNSGGRLSEKDAVELISGNVYKMLAVKESRADRQGFLIYEGSPFEIDSRIIGVSDGQNDEVYIAQ